MKSTLIWFILIGAILLLGDSVAAWNRQFFNRYSRNFFRNAPVANAIGVGDINASPGAAATGRASNNEIDELNALFGNANGNVDGIMGDGNLGINAGAIGGGAGGFGIGQQQTEVYGIVEPLIEDSPCADRPCNSNDDCCPTGVCVNTYGEGKCIYVYGRKSDLCHRNTDCEAGMSCVKGAAGNMICQAIQIQMHNNNNIPAAVGGGISGINGVGSGATKLFEVHQFGEDCVSSSDCNVAKGMCCQLQRSHHRMLPKKMCAYFRDPFMCVDIMPTEDEEIRESRFHSAFSQRHM